MVIVDVDLSHLKRFGPAMPKIQQRGLQLVGLDLLKPLQRYSPVDKGLLRQWAIVSQSQSEVKIQSPAYYADWVNDGHSQQPGRFIPGSWNGDKFVYKPGAKTGMVLKKSHVSGKHFVEKSIQEVKPRIEQNFQVAINEVLG